MTASLLLTLPANAQAQISIRLNGVPERLSYPLPGGSNLILTATIKGGQMKSTWLAITEDSGRVMLAKVDESEYAINLGAQEVYDLLKAGGTDGQFRLYAQAMDGTTVRSLAVRYTMHVVPERLHSPAVPARLDFPFDEAKMTIYQRASKKLPGAVGALRIHLGDITAGQVLVSINGPRGELVVDTMPMQEGDILSLRLVEQDYVLRLDKLVNFLIGDDYGVFTLMPLHQLEAQRIDDLLRVIEKAEATFIRNDVDLSGEEFATHLRAKHTYLGPRKTSLTDFIENVASRSSTTGQSYRVKLPSGDIVDADAWLREQAAKLVKEPR